MSKTEKRVVKLPADPEEQNDDRAGKAMEAVHTFMTATGLTDADGLDTAILDLLADLAHLCDRKGLELAELLRRAKDHYEPETFDDEGEVTGTQFEGVL